LRAGVATPTVLPVAGHFAGQQLRLLTNREGAGHESRSFLEGVGCTPHFQEFSQYLQAQVAQGAVDSFEPFLIEPNSGELTGFFLIKGDALKLAGMTASPEWKQHVLRASMHLDGLTVMRGVAGDALMTQMRMWGELIPA
jgi:hypothetical protein